MGVTEPRTNWAALGDGMYLVRTGAGLRQAIRHFNSDLDKHDLRYLPWPKKYPCVVSFYYTHRGHDYLDARYTTLNKLRAILTEHDNCTIINNPPEM